MPLLSLEDRGREVTGLFSSGMQPLFVAAGHKYFESTTCFGAYIHQSALLVFIHTRTAELQEAAWTGQGEIGPGLGGALPS